MNHRDRVLWAAQRGKVVQQYENDSLADWEHFLKEIHKGKTHDEIDSVCKAFVEKHYRTDFYYKSDDLLYIRIPKNASTSLCKSFPRLMHPSGKRVFQPLEEIDPEEIMRSLVLVRNPFDRLVSVWQDRACDRPPEATPLLSAQIEEGRAGARVCIRPDGSRQILSGEITFERFVEVVSRIPDTVADDHFRSQYSFIEGLLPSTRPSYSHIHLHVFKLENLTTQWGVLCDLMGSTEFTTNQYYLKTSDRNFRDYRAYYITENEKGELVPNVPLIDLVRKRYHKDLDFFGYDFEDISGERDSNAPLNESDRQREVKPLTSKEEAELGLRRHGNSIKGSSRPL